MRLKMRMRIEAATNSLAHSRADTHCAAGREKAEIAPRQRDEAAERETLEQPDHHVRTWNNSRMLL